MTLSVKLLRNQWIFAAGPLKIKVNSGKIEVFGWEYKKNSEVIINNFRSAPICALEDSELFVEFEENSYLFASEKPLIPEEWKTFAEECLKMKQKPLKIMVLGGVDVGKTGFITFCANYFLQKKKRVFIIDADTGQQDIAFPTCIGLGSIDAPVTHISDAKMIDAFFIGRTSPAELFQRVLVGIKFLLNEAVENKADIILIDTTGWVFDLGRELKTMKILSISPHVVAILEKENELSHYDAIFRKVAESLGIKIKHLPASPTLRARTREERREIRKSLYLKALQNAKEITLKLHELSVFYGYIGTGKLMKIDDLMCEEHPEMIIVFSNEKIDQEKIKSIETQYGKKVITLNPDDLKEMLIGLVDDKMHFLGLGIVLDYNPQTDEIRIYTNAPPEKIAGLMWGYMKISTEGEEKAWLKPFQI